jgi:hypothetical protein
MKLPPLRPLRHGHSSRIVLVTLLAAGVLITAFVSSAAVSALTPFHAGSASGLTATKSAEQPHGQITARHTPAPVSTF